MEVSGVIFRHVPCTSGVGIDAPSLNPSFPARLRVVSSVPAGHSISGEKLKIDLGSSRGSCSRPRMAFGVLDSGFADNGHLEYYRGVPRCGGEKKEKNLGAISTKKKLKLLKGLLSNDLSMFSELGSGSGSVDSIGLVGEVQEKAISDASEVLIEHLQKVREEEKKIKRDKKVEKAKMKASKKEDSSSSSSSSDSENEEVIDMTCLRSNALEQPKVNVLQSAPAATLIVSAPSTQEEKMIQEGLGVGIVEVSQEKETSTSIGTYSSSCSSISSSISVVDRSSSVTKSSFTKSIEVCMGNKCKKSGGAQLLEEFKRVVGIEGAVVGCKCMGKCRDGPNVRILNCVDGTHSEVVDNSIRTPTNSICIGVGLEDVAVIVANFLGENPDNLGMSPAS